MINKYLYMQGSIIEISMRRIFYDNFFARISSEVLFNDACTGSLNYQAYPSNLQSAGNISAAIHCRIAITCCHIDYECVWCSLHLL